MYYILEILGGTALGFCLGLIPNLHINLIGYLFGLCGIFIFFHNSFYFFFSICVAQTLTSIIPSFLFYTQTQDTLISPFLGQQFSNSSDLKHTLLLSFLSFIFGGVFSVLFLPIFYLLFLLFSDFYVLIFIVLILFLAFLVFQEKDLLSRLLVLSIVIFSGVLGIFTLKYNFFFKEPLIACIFGLFALPNLMLVIFSKENTLVSNNQKIEESTDSVSFKQLVSFSFIGTIFSSLIAIVPSLSPGLAMTVASFFQSGHSKKRTVIFFSSILSSVLLFYFFLSVVFNKSRVGYISLLQSFHIIPKMFLPDLIFLVSSFLLVLSLTVFLGYLFLNPILELLNHFNKKTILVYIFYFSIILILIFCGIGGLFLVLISGAIGFLPMVYNKNRLALMSYLIVPTILFFM